ncbi:DUF2846 domain-containing protein [Sandarakinorhabdus oryzae]|uniref:DUF2846 domain-containing protein n=1 Tax=Sandarakinorhabdus oryzae TaxID=2675220 RepID=UPI0012E2479C|nr:DUF2846 domain-containing protein [Sandarakinorhabdus oryzae]
MKTTIQLAAAFALLASPALAAEKAPPTPITIAPPPEGKGQIVFFRRGGIGPLISCAVSENGARVSRLPPGKYFVQVTTPGAHTYTVSSEAKDTLNVEVEAGETQYAKCNIRMGILAGRPNLAPSTKDEFDKGAGKLKLVEPQDDKDDDKKDDKK